MFFYAKKDFFGKLLNSDVSKVLCEEKLLCKYSLLANGPKSGGDRLLRKEMVARFVVEIGKRAYSRSCAFSPHVTQTRQCAE